MMCSMLSEDREILRQVWEGRVAVCVCLAAQDVSTLGQPDPHYLMLPRISYFTLLLDKVRKIFQRFVSHELKDNEMWLEFEGVPLKVQYPVGALYDLHNRECEAPWQLTAHFSPLPTTLISLPCRESVESQFLSHIKEADALKHRGAVITTLQSRDHKQLWLGLVNDKFEQFWSINQKLMSSGDGSSAGGNGGGGGGCGSSGFRSIPFKLHSLPENCHSPQHGKSAEPSLPAPVMRLARPTTEEGQPALLSHLMDDVLGELLCPDDVVVVQGVVPPRDTPLLWLSQHLSYPDNFLHFCVRRAVKH